MCVCACYHTQALNKCYLIYMRHTPMCGLNLHIKVRKLHHIPHVGSANRKLYHIPHVGCAHLAARPKLCRLFITPSVPHIRKTTQDLHSNQKVDSSSHHGGEMRTIIAPPDMQKRKNEKNR